MKIRTRHRVEPLCENMDEAASDLIGLYIHDDRYGPYLRAEILPKEYTRRTVGGDVQKSAFAIALPRRKAGGQSVGTELWTVSHILIPMHAKIRLAFSGLRQLASDATNLALGYSDAFQIQADEIPDRTIMWDTWIVRAHKYVEGLFVGANNDVSDRIAEICKTISLARYVGIIRLSGSYFDPIDIVVDTTSTIPAAER